MKMNKMEYCSLAPGLEVSRIITGLWQVADMERLGHIFDLSKTRQAMDMYVDAGFSTFDMADHYGSAELIAGAYREYYGSDKKVELLTKWVPRPGRIGIQEAREAVMKALDRLKSDSIDLLQFHAWNYADPIWLDTLFWLDEMRREGLIGSIGLTNFDAVHLKMVLDSNIPVVSNQVCFSLLDNRASGNLTKVCKAGGIKLLAFGVLAGGFLTEKWWRQPPPGETSKKNWTWSQMKYYRFIEQTGGWNNFQKCLDAIALIAEKHRISFANVAGRFILDQPAVGAIIIGARLNESEHIENNKAMLQVRLDREDFALLSNVQDGLLPIPGDCGDEYRRPPYLTASGDLSHHLKVMPAPYEVRHGKNGRSKILSGTVWEDIAGFCRAVKVGNRILISGTTATNKTRIIGGNDATSQTHFIIDKIEGALISLGASLEDIVRTRIYIQNYEDWEAVSRVHGLRLGHVQPVNTLVKADIIGEGYLVEIEAEALLP